MPRRNIANMLTSSRFVLSPIFAAVFLILDRIDGFLIVGISLLWFIMLLIELSDALDGAVARRTGTVSDIGKILDPFADVVSKVTYFACLLVAGIVPLWFVLIVLYREFGIILVRMILYRDGIALGAHLAGKLKTWFYGITAGVGLLVLSIGTVAGDPVIASSRSMPTWQSVLLTVLFIITAALSVGSFIEYLVLFSRARRSRPASGSGRQRPAGPEAST